MGFPLVEIIEKLLTPDDAVIKEGTLALHDALKNPATVGELCQVMGGAPTVPVRQYAAVILRKRLNKSRNWNKLDQAVKNGIKDGVLQTLIQEPDHSVRTAIAQLVGVIARQELPSGQWPGLIQSLVQLLQSQHPKERETGVFIVSVVSNEAADQLGSHLTQMLPLFSTQLTDSNLTTSFHTIQILTNFAPMVGQDHMADYQKLLPSTIAAVQRMVLEDEEKAVQAMDLFDVLAECEVALLVPQLKQVLQLCLDVSSDVRLTHPLRIKAIAFLGYIVRIKKKYIAKQKLGEIFVKTLFGILCEEGEGEDSALGFLGGDNVEGDTPIHAAAQALDSCALHLPPDKLLPTLLPLVEASLKSQNPQQVKGAYLSLAMVAEGCADTLRTKHLYQLLQCISQGIISEHQVIRNSALFALGQFAEHLQPDISKYHSELLPVLFEYLKQICTMAQNGCADPPGVDKMFYALEVFCEHLEEEVLPHLPPLMECLLSLLKMASSLHLKELAISAIGATANAAKEHMMPYFESIVELIKGYLVQKHQEETLTLQVQALDTLGQLCRQLGAKNFLKYAPDCCDLGLNLLVSKEDPDVRKSVYLLFAALSSVMKEDLHPHLPKVMDSMMLSLRSTEGIVAHTKEDIVLGANIEGLDSESEDEEVGDDLDIAGEADENGDDDGDIEGFSVENAFVAEKEDTCVALKELALHCGERFYPYLDKCCEEVYKMMNFPNDEVRQAALGTMAQFVISLHKYELQEDKENKEGFCKWIQVVVPKFSELIHTDEEYGVVMAGLEAYAELLREVGLRVIEPPGHLQAIINCITNVMSGKTVCQDMADEAASEEEGEAEQDEMLVEYAGEVVPNLGKALGSTDFALHFPQLLPLFVNKMKKSCSVAERSFSIGTLAESVESLGPYTCQFVDVLLPLFLTGCRDPDEEVRSNALYGLGVLGQHGGDPIAAHYPTLLSTLSDALSKEQFPRSIDNICGAVARLITARRDLVPMDQVFPVLLRCLPLREDFEENKTVFRCISDVYDPTNTLVQQNLGIILRLCLMVYGTKQMDEEADDCVKNLLLRLKTDLTAEQMTQVLSVLEPALASRFQELLPTQTS